VPGVLGRAGTAPLSVAATRNAVIMVGPGDHGGSRGRSPAWNAGIKDQLMITEHRAGDHPGGRLGELARLRPARPPPGVP
jgi:hypothetical protein